MTDDFVKAKAEIKDRWPELVDTESDEYGRKLRILVNQYARDRKRGVVVHRITSAEERAISKIAAILRRDVPELAYPIVKRYERLRGRLVGIRHAHDLRMATGPRALEDWKAVHANELARLKGMEISAIANMFYDRARRAVLPDHVTSEVTHPEGER